MKKVFVMLAVICLVLSVDAFGGGKQMSPEMRQKMLEKYDADGDGKLSDEERATAKAEMQGKREAMQSQMLEKYDTDGDGKLSDEEKQAAKADREAKRAEMLEKYDTDGDGKLNESEREAAKADMSEEPKSE